MAPEELWSQ